jgi:hypothetical protein
MRSDAEVSQIRKQRQQQQQQAAEQQQMMQEAQAVGSAAPMVKAVQQ